MKSSLKTLSIFTVAAIVAAGCGAADNENAADNNAVTAAENEHMEETNENNEEAESNENNEENADRQNEGHNHNDGDGHDHDHHHDDESEEIYSGYFEDEQVEDRMLTDWEGDWQSVYPYLKEGELEEVFAEKAAESDDMTAEEYEEYYEIGYETSVDRIVIEEDSFTFYDGEEVHTSEYSYDGYEILTYEAGNRGVRFIFAREGESEEMPQYIQFSDHSIYPTDAHHFHLYWGDDREELLEELTNWPTYYPSEMDGEEIAGEMLAH